MLHSHNPGYFAITMLFALAMIWPFNSGQTERLTPTQLAPAATGVATVNKGANGNTIINLKVKYLAPASMLNPAQNTYIVWIEPKGHPAREVAALQPNNNREANLTFPSPYSDFDLLITAESTPQAKTPSQQVVMKGHISG